MRYDAEDMLYEDLERGAKESLTAPSPASFNDDRLYTTHGNIGISHAVNSGDLLSESNHEQVLDYLNTVAANTEHVTACCWENGERIEGAHEDYVLAGRIHDWALGPLMEIFVQVYEADGVTFTEVFTEAAAIALNLRDYPVFDEADFCERELNDFNTQWEREIVSDLCQVHEDDDDVDVSAIATIAYGMFLDLDGGYAEALNIDDEDRQKVWDQARDQMYLARAHEQLAATIEGQAALDIR